MYLLTIQIEGTAKAVLRKSNLEKKKGTAIVHIQHLANLSLLL
jgi:hypothetical protein